MVPREAMSVLSRDYLCSVYMECRGPGLVEMPRPIGYGRNRPKRRPYLKFGES